MVPHPSSPDVDRRPVDLSTLVSSVSRDVLPGRREYAALTDLDHRRHVAVFTVDVGRRYSAKTSTPKGGMNRYSNILPYDRNRVVLRSPVHGCDYINASWIRPPKREPLAGKSNTLVRDDQGTERLSVIAAQGL